MRIIFSFLLVLQLAGSLNAATPEQTHPFSIHDMLTMDRISDPQVSPDGKQILYSRARVGEQSGLWVMNRDGCDQHLLTLWVQCLRSAWQVAGGVNAPLLRVRIL